MPLLSFLLTRLGIALLCCGLWAATAQAQYTLLLPDQPTQEGNAKEPKKQMDVLLALGDPFSLNAVDMEMPQMFAVLRRMPLTLEEQALEGQSGKRSGGVKSLREELLGDLEEIRYMDKKAWAAHVDMEIPGLYQLMAETRPRWDDGRGMFEQQFAKVVLPVLGVEQGWDSPVGLAVEIVPLTRPFGLMAPALFSAKVLRDNEPLADSFVRVGRLNTERRGVPGPWHAEQVLKTDGDGNFSFLCSQPGWWAFMAVTQGTPMKGGDGQPKALELGALLWVYVDDAKLGTFKPQKPRVGQP